MSRRRPNQSQTDAPGQDSFLDIVANLVGILLILIMVVGIRTKDALVEASQTSAAAEVAETEDPAEDSESAASADTDEPAPDPYSIDVEGAASATRGVETRIAELDQHLQKQQIELDYRSRERDRIQLLLSAAERKLNDMKADLDTQQQQAIQDQQKLLAAQRDLEKLRIQAAALAGATSPVERLDHLPTPMAKTVFGKEEHFRLSDGKLAHVPWDDLVGRLKDDAPNKIWKLKDAPKITETIGPLGGFRLRYTLKKSEQLVKTDSGNTVRQQRASLDFFHLIPVEDQLGEPIQQAIDNPISQLNNVLGANDPKNTTITVWVYPDSFEAFRQLKEHLFQLGYLTASRPMPEGRYMGGAPDGKRSASQ